MKELGRFIGISNWRPGNAWMVLYDNAQGGRNEMCIFCSDEYIYKFRSTVDLGEILDRTDHLHRITYDKIRERLRSR